MFRESFNWNDLQATLAIHAINTINTNTYNTFNTHIESHQITVEVIAEISKSRFQSTEWARTDARDTIPSPRGEFSLDGGGCERAPVTVGCDNPKSFRPTDRPLGTMSGCRTKSPTRPTEGRMGHPISRFLREFERRLGHPREEKPTLRHRKAEWPTAPVNYLLTAWIAGCNHE